MRRLAAAVAWFVLALPLYAAYPARELYVPIAGRGIGANGRMFYSTLSITNLTRLRNRVRIEFLVAGQPNPQPRALELTLQGEETRVFDPVGDELLGGRDAVGAIHVSAERRVVASCRSFSRLASDPVSRAVGAHFSAVPERFAIGNGESTLLAGVSLVRPPQSTYRVYVVETAASHLSYSIEILDLSGKTIAQKPFFIRPHEQRSIDLATEFATTELPTGLARIRGINGNGKIIVAGGEVLAESRDTVPYDMTFATDAGPRMPLAETLTYVAVALAVIVAAWFYRR